MFENSEEKCIFAKVFLLKSQMKKIDKEEFVRRAREVHGNRYDYSKVEYVSMTTKVCVVCPEHGEFWQTPSSHLRGNNCPVCANYNRGNYKRGNREEFIKKAMKIHGDKYDYSKVEYMGAMDKVTIICPEHGEFLQAPMQHLLGHGCPKCKGRGLSLDELIETFRKIHENKYDYSKVEKVSNLSKDKVCIICPDHGEFWQVPSKHLQGQGCPKCAKIKANEKKQLTTEEFVNRARKIHGDKYGYQKTQYVNAIDNVEIICPKHGPFFQKPFDHLTGHGCPKCAVLYSYAESEIYQYLCGILGKDKVVFRDRSHIGKQEIDIYVPSKMVGIEYNGLYWHSEAGGKNKWYHYNKMRGCNRKGIRLIQIFEDEYVGKKEIVLSKLAHILGVEPVGPRVMGRMSTVRKVSNTQAKEFLEENHIQGYTNCTVALGAFYQGILVGVMCFTRTGKEGVWILTRFATDIKYRCQGIGGKLFTHFVRAYNPIQVKSFADRRWTLNKDENLYTKLGFGLEEELAPDYHYIEAKNPNRRIHKFNLRKKSLHRKYDLPMDMTESQMVDALGYARIWDCGLLKYVWKKPE